MQREQLTTALAIVVAAVWAVAALAAILNGRTTVLAAITPVMLIVAGFLFGYRTASPPSPPKPPRKPPR